MGELHLIAGKRAHPLSERLAAPWARAPREIATLEQCHKGRGGQIHGAPHCLAVGSLLRGGTYGTINSPLVHHTFRQDTKIVDRPGRVQRPG
jgi:hypothetical protein